MAITDKLNAAHTELSQAQDVSTARALIQPIREDVLRVNSELQAIADSGVFDTVDNEIKAAHTELSQAQDVSTARALIQPIREDVLRVNSELQAIADSGVFDTVDNEIKAALIKAWNVVKAAKVGFEDVDVAELLNWRP